MFIWCSHVTFCIIFLIGEKNWTDVICASSVIYTRHYSNQFGDLEKFRIFNPGCWWCLHDVYMPTFFGLHPSPTPIYTLSSITLRMSMFGGAMGFTNSFEVFLSELAGILSTSWSWRHRRRDWDICPAISTSVTFITELVTFTWFQNCDIISQWRHQSFVVITDYLFIANISRELTSTGYHLCWRFSTNFVNNQNNL